MIRIGRYDPPTAMACQYDHRSGWRRPKGYRLAVDVARARTHCHDGMPLPEHIQKRRSRPAAGSLA
jgi:hypothetical protein